MSMTFGSNSSGVTASRSAAPPPPQSTGLLSPTAIVHLLWIRCFFWSDDSSRRKRSLVCFDDEELDIRILC